MMTRLLLLPDDRTQLNVEVELQAAELEILINHGQWHPPPGLAAHIPQPERLHAVRLGENTVLAFCLPDGPSQVSKSANTSLLSPRQLSILHYLAEGKTIKQICQLLGLSRRTVFLHTAALRHKLHALTTPAAVSRAAALGLIRSRQSGKEAHKDPEG